MYNVIDVGEGMAGEEDAGVRFKSRLDRFGGNAECVRIDFRKDGFYANLQGDICCGEVAKSGDDHLISGPKTHAEVYKVDCCCAVGCRDGKRRAGECCHLALETVNKGTTRYPGRIKSFNKVLRFQAPKVRLCPSDG